MSFAQAARTASSVCDAVDELDAEAFQKLAREALGLTN